MTALDPKQANAAFAATLQPIVDVLKTLDANQPAVAQRELTKRLPLDGPVLTAIRAAAEAGAAAGWQLPKENMGVRFGRVAKDLAGFSVDAVAMHGPGPKHRHTNGEFDLCFATGGAPTFDGHPPGWVVFGPGSVHVPTVAGGSMLILYFLPAGGIEFLTDGG